MTAAAPPASSRPTPPRAPPSSPPPRARGAELASHRHPLAGPRRRAALPRRRRASARPTRAACSSSPPARTASRASAAPGIQTFLLARRASRRALPDGVALVLVHAVNPWGFAWLRRVNEDNVDLNRNFLDHGAPHPENPDYDGLYDVLNPTQLDDGGGRRGPRRAAQVRGGARRSRGAIARCRAASTRHPRGPAVRRPRTGLVEPHAARALGAPRRRRRAPRCCIDLHSGLGPNGVGPPPADGARRRATRRALARDLVARRDPRPSPPQASDAALVSRPDGPGLRRAPRRTRRAIGLVLEFGTLRHAAGDARGAGRQLAPAPRRRARPPRAARSSSACATRSSSTRTTWKEKVCRRAQRGRRPRARRASARRAPAAAAGADRARRAPGRGGRRSPTSTSRWRARPRSSRSTARPLRARRSRRSSPIRRAAAGSSSRTAARSPRRSC